MLSAERFVSSAERHLGRVATLGVLLLAWWVLSDERPLRAQDVPQGTAANGTAVDNPDGQPARDVFARRPQPWRRYDQPVLSAHTTKQDWCQVVMYSPHVIVHDGKFHMWYLGSSAGPRPNDISVGYAWSDDGIEWNEHGQNPILTAADVPWGRFWQTPFVLFDSDEEQFKMWFVSGRGVTRDQRRQIIENDQRLGYATSRDGVQWNVRPTPIYPSGRSPSVIKIAPDRYRMWMNSRPDTSDTKSGELYTNIYEFASHDGIDWKRSDKPVISPSGSISTTVYPFVIRQEREFHIWYGGHRDRKFELFHATSAEGIKWSTDHQQAVFPARAEPGFFDSRYTSTPCIVSLPDRFLLYYSARDLNNSYVDRQGRKHIDGAGIYSHIGVAELKLGDARSAR